MTGVRRRDLLAGAAALAGFATVGLLPGTAAAATRQRPGAANPPSLGVGDRAVTARVSARRALEHIRHLSETIGPRIGGTPSERRAADYLARELRDLRYDVKLQPFPVADKHLADVLGDGIRWQSAASPDGALDVSVTGDVVDVRAGAAGDYPADVRGKVVLVDRVRGSELAQVKTAVEKGAAAVVLVATPAPTAPDRRAGSFSPSLKERVAVPVLGLAQVHGEKVRARLSGGRLRLTLRVTHHKNLTSYNVIAERPATLPVGDRGVVMVSAHYDSVPGSPGANDDGSGTALCLELARVLRHLPTQKAVRFALWGSEEQGLIGSKYYVSKLDDAGAKRIAGCFQNDMVATSHDPATRYWLLSVDGGDNATTKAVADAARRLGYTPRVSGPVARGSSDHVPFHERGIASANFSWRGEGGPHLLEPTYHTPEDTIEANISLERLQVSLELIGCAAYDLARHR
ncbi:Zn-dependent amino- or carboxypeptidase, M28 family [Streptoalloteichus tenebrarius]|uniref:Zn-dependent amino- or carboxypeptidase, M28 family n=1 Tax=Streptoalloteichus tenebrarius (strain ATCC 17920 / DSM 40477 / JCM 4838 / CBS 697.72 / NBRC 16177 / NCIMB 11028 / NRRL B-12390 / A12253. 1 / ISP 5477) TaxID=1933 RepID=A0ABT1I423_STRSD|nr:M28 family peptidase [Streptoalloteichus tenebrarius]MCP2262537.1 Zn-dependent amino- or carboxypeptidase, M28 family [Streptoalloteichus tenebrarius]BFF01243.1 M28 family metallopeptidase [Streptoalloteichus tenebrarius]